MNQGPFASQGLAGHSRFAQELDPGLDNDSWRSQEIIPAADRGIYNHAATQGLEPLNALDRSQGGPGRRVRLAEPLGSQKDQVSPCLLDLAQVQALLETFQTPSFKIL
jgi:hypothetical protein